jgi:hypothetical protein
VSLNRPSTPGCEGKKTAIDRTETAGALGKVIAFLAFGNPGNARFWFQILATILGMGDMLKEG